MIARFASGLFLCVLAGCGGAPARAPSRPVAIPLVQPVSFGELRAHAAVLWTRTASRAFVHARLADRHFVAASSDESDFTVRIALNDLPTGPHDVVVWASETGDEEAPREPAWHGALRLAAEPDARVAVRFGFGGDIAGQNVCRDAVRGFPLAVQAAAEPTDFFVALGDMIYADDVCTETGSLGNAQLAGDFDRSVELGAFRAHWQYAEADSGYSALREQVYAVWDDHETTNDVGPHHDSRAGTPSLFPPARRAFFEHNALDANAPLYRSFRHGAHVELFILDTRSFRDANDRPDSASAPKSMLGATQRAWFEDALIASSATWKIVVSSVPLAIPTGRADARDGWADDASGLGFESELLAILRRVKQGGVERLVFITTDVHFAEVLVHHPEGGPELFEVVTGPMNAGLFPNRTVDATLRSEVLFFHGPEHHDDVVTYDAALPWFNYGLVDVDAAGALTVRIRGLGTTLYEHTLTP